MTIGTIVGYVVLGLGIVTLLLLILNIVICLVAGFGRSINKLICLALSCLVFILGINFLANAILNIKVDYEEVSSVVASIDEDAANSLAEQGFSGVYTLEEVIAKVVTDSIYKDDPSLAENSKVSSLVAGLVQMALKLVVYFVGIALVILLYNVFKFILWILRSIIYRKPIERKQHLLGLPIGIAAFLLMFIVFVTPMYGFLSAASTIAGDVAEYGKDANVIDTDTCFELTEASTKVENSVVRKVAYGALTNMFYKDSNFAADAHFTKNILSFETTDGKFSLIDDYDDISTALPAMFKVYNLVNEAQASSNKIVSLASLTQEDIDNIATVVGNSSLLQVVLPAAGEYLSYYLVHNAELALSDEAKSAATKLKDVNWPSELTKLADIIKTLKDYRTVEFSVENVTELLKSKDFVNMCETLVNKLLELEMVNDVAVPIAMDKVIDSLKDNESLKDFNLKTDELKKLVWKDEIKALLNVVFEVANAYQVLDFDQNDWSKVLDNPEFTNYLNKVIDKALESKALKEQIIPSLANKIGALTSEMKDMNLSFVKEIVTEESIVNLLENDVDALVEILRDLKSIGLFKDGAKLDLQDTTNQDTMIKVVKAIFNLSVVKGKEASVFKGVMDLANLQETFTKYGVTLDFNSVTDWSTEVDNLCDIFKNAMKVVGNFDEFSLDTLLKNTKDATVKEQVADIIDGISKSQIMGGSMFDIINKMLESMDKNYAVTFTEADKTVIQNETGWKQETLVILNIVDSASSLLQNTNVDYASLDANVIKNIMLDASQGVIATKVVGNVLNQLFKGTLNFDFTIRANMSSCAETVYSAITLAQTMTSKDMNFNDPDSVNKVLGALDGFAENEKNVDLINDLINETMTGEGDSKVNLSKEEIKEVSGVMSKVFSEYQKADKTTQQNYSAEDLPQEVQEEVENNELAKLLVKYYFK